MPQYATLYLQYCMGHAYNASHRITRFSWRRWGDLRIDLWSEDNTKALYRRSLAGWMFGKCCMPRMGGSFSKLERFILGQKYKHTHTHKHVFRNLFAFSCEPVRCDIKDGPTYHMRCEMWCAKKSTGWHLSYPRQALRGLQLDTEGPPTQCVRNYFEALIEMLEASGETPNWTCGLLPQGLQKDHRETKE